MASTGSEHTRLIVVRGNSASGKSTTAWALREWWGRRLAVVEQDYLRRRILKAHDTDEGPQYGLIEQTVTYCLDYGYDVVLEGILHRQRYRPMLERLAENHRGVTAAYYFDISWAETLRRHASRAKAVEFDAEDMRGWYCPRDTLGWPGERLVPDEATLDTTCERIVTDLAHEQRGSRRVPLLPRF